MDARLIPDPLRNRISPLYWQLKAIRMRPTTKIRLDNIVVHLYTETPEECKIITNTKNTEEEILRDFATRINEDDIVYDIGANVGQYTCIATQCGANAVAFEPLPANAERIRENIKLNNGSALVVQAALADNDGKSSFKSDSKETGADQGHLTTGHGQTVQTFRGETYVKEGKGPKPTVVKIDVEGAEIDVLHGFGNVLNECRLVYVEIHLDKSKRYNKIFDILDNRGFDTEILTERESQDIVCAYKS